MTPLAIYINPTLDISGYLDHLQKHHSPLSIAMMTLVRFFHFTAFLWLNLLL